MNDELIVPQEQVDDAPESARQFELRLTFTADGVKIDLKSNLSPLEQLGAIEIFKAHVLSSALGNKE